MWKNVSKKEILALKKVVGRGFPSCQSTVSRCKSAQKSSPYNNILRFGGFTVLLISVHPNNRTTVQPNLTSPRNELPQCGTSSLLQDTFLLSHQKP